MLETFHIQSSIFSCNLFVFFIWCRCLSKGMNAIVEIQTQRPVSLELYKDYKELGRFMLRYVGSTIAAGVVTEVKWNSFRITPQQINFQVVCKC